MSRNAGGLNIENLDQWLDWLKTLDKESVDNMKSRMLRSAGLRILEYVDDGTPRRTGRLQNSMSMGAQDNYFKLKVGRTSFVAVGTAVEYAAAVENGFSQADRRGDFVPGFWRSGTFHYQPGATTGMVLTGAIIEGAHMFRNAMDNLAQGDMDTIAEFEFRRLYAELFRG